MDTEFFFITSTNWPSLYNDHLPIGLTPPPPSPHTRPTGGSCGAQLKPLTCFLVDHLGKQALVAIRKAMREFHKRSCVKFVPRINEQDYIEFEGNLG